jgi:hypothetical protein
VLFINHPVIVNTNTYTSLYNHEQFTDGSEDGAMVEMFSNITYFSILASTSCLYVYESVGYVYMYICLLLNQSSATGDIWLDIILMIYIECSMCRLYVSFVHLLHILNQYRRIPEFHNMFNEGDVQCRKLQNGISGDIKHTIVD